jgi:hypothetical protein
MKLFRIIALPVVLVIIFIACSYGFSHMSHLSFSTLQKDDYGIGIHLGMSYEDLSRSMNDKAISENTYAKSQVYAIGYNDGFIRVDENEAMHKIELIVDRSGDVMGISISLDRRIHRSGLKFQGKNIESYDERGLNRILSQYGDVLQSEKETYVYRFTDATELRAIAIAASFKEGRLESLMLYERNV